MVAKFADDTKICRGTGSVEEAGRLQNELDRLGGWAKKCRVEYNVGKYEVMDFGRKNRGVDYFLNGKRLWKSEAQRDLGVLVQDSLNVNMQVQLAVRKANSVLAFMLRGQEYRSRDVLLRLDKALVSPHL